MSFILAEPNAELEGFLNEVAKRIPPPKERTLFSLGGCGYYENPASDLLAFFLTPDAEHGFKALFLSTYFECMNVDHSKINKNGVRVDREVVAKDGARIDLEIQGLNWCLLIENKIFHWEANPFASYEEHAKTICAGEKLFSILSPSGKIEKKGKNEDWKRVSYQDYCKALKQKLAEDFWNFPISKWHIFAREFILHMENELYNPPMTIDLAAFVEKHTSQIIEVQKLAWQYQNFICDELKRELNKNFSPNSFYIVPEDWGFRCKTAQWGEPHVVLIKPDGLNQKFSVRAYFQVSEPLLTNAKNVLKHMKPPVSSGGWIFWNSTNYDSREEAVAELCKLAQIMNDLLKTDALRNPEPKPTAPAA